MSKGLHTHLFQRLPCSREFTETPSAHLFQASTGWWKWLRWTCSTHQNGICENGILCVDHINIHNFVSMAKHKTIAPASPPLGRPRTSCDHKVGPLIYPTLCWDTLERDSAKKSFFSQTHSCRCCLPYRPWQSSLMAYFPHGFQAHQGLALSIKLVSFLQEKEINRNWFENVKPYQLPAVTPRQIFHGWHKRLISSRLFSWLQQSMVSPINPPKFPGGLLEGEMA